MSLLGGTGLGQDISSHVLSYLDPGDLARVSTTSISGREQVEKSIPYVSLERGYLEPKNELPNKLKYLYQQENEPVQIRLYNAVLNNRLDIIKYWIRPDMDITTPLCGAAETNNIDLLDLLTQYSNNYNINAVLIYALQHGSDLNTIKYLVTKGADPTDNEALYTSAQSSLDVFKYIMSFRTDVFTDNIKYNIAKNSLGGDGVVLSYVLSIFGFNIHDLNGILTQAYRSINDIKILVAYGANSFLGPMIGCIRDNLIDNIKYIISTGHGGDNQALIEAAGLGRIEIMQLIINARPSNPGLALIPTVEAKQLESVKLLVKSYGDTISSYTYVQAIDEALKQDSKDIFTILLHHIPSHHVAGILKSKKYNLDSDQIRLLFDYVLEYHREIEVISETQRSDVIYYLIDTNLIKSIAIKQPYVIEQLIVSTIKIDDTDLLSQVIVNVKVPMYHILQQAAISNSINIVTLLLTTDYSKDGLLLSDLDYALVTGSEENKHSINQRTNILLEHGAIYSTDMPNLLYCIMHNYTYLVKYLINNVSDRDLKQTVKYVIDNSLSLSGLIEYSNKVIYIALEYMIHERDFDKATNIQMRYRINYDQFLLHAIANRDVPVITYLLDNIDYSQRILDSIRQQAINLQDDVILSLL